jgi:hypothetical protein
MKKHNPFNKPDFDKPAGFFMVIAELFVRLGFIGSLSGWIFTGWMFFGLVMVIGGITTFFTGSPINVNGVPTDTTWARVEFLLVALSFTAIGMIYVFFVKPRLPEAEFRVGYGRCHQSINETTPSDNMTKPSECISCGGVIPEKTNECPDCDWSYAESASQKET